MITDAASARQFVWFFSAKLLPGLIMLACVPIWVARFGAAAYGAYAVSWSISIALVSLATGWLRQSTLRYAGDIQGGLRAHPNSVLLVACGLAPALAAPLVFMIVPSARTLGATLAVLAFVLSFAVYGLAQAAAQRDGRAAAFNSGEVLRVAAALGLSLLLPMQWYGLTTILVSSAVGNCLGIAATLPWGASRPLPLSRTWSNTRRSWSYGWPMSLWLGASAATLYMDRVILGFFVDASVVGAYAATADIVVRGFTIIGAPVLLVVHPMLMRLWNTGGDREVGLLLHRWKLILGWTLAAVTTGAIVLLPEFLELVGLASVDRLVIAGLAAGAAAWQFALLAHKPLEFADKTKLMLALMTVALLVEAVVCVILGLAWGVRGVAIGLLCASLSYNVFVVQAVRLRRLNV